MTGPNEPTLGDVLRSVWTVKLFVLTGGLIGLGIAVLFLSLATPSYRAEMIVAPADGYALGDYASSGRLDQSITLPFWRPAEPETVSTDFYRFVHTSRGPSAAAILLKDKTVLTGIRKSADRYGANTEWTPARLSEYLKKYVKVEPLGATPLRRVRYLHPDPDFAAALLRKIHLVADQMIRRDRRRQSQARITYLRSVLSDTGHPDHRKGITNLLMQQEHVQMLANLDEPYAAIVVEPPAASSKPAWPNPALIVPAFLLIGLFLGYVTGSTTRLPDRRHG